MAVVDDEVSVHAALRNGLQSLVPEWTMESHLKPLEAIQKICSHPPEAVLMDLLMPQLSGIDCTRRIKTLLPHLPVIMLTARTDDEGILLSLMAGASGYLIKPASAEDVVHAVTEVVHGGTFLCQQAQRTIVACFGGCASLQALQGLLSRREQEILACLFRGLFDKEIGDELHISTGTVHSHLVRLFRKLGVHSRKEALQRFLGAS
ncbi:MAG: response regulator transcription factor, partial [Verrucomicrobiota bacterium]